MSSEYRLNNANRIIEKSLTTKMCLIKYIWNSIFLSPIFHICNTRFITTKLQNVDLDFVISKLLYHSRFICMRQYDKIHESDFFQKHKIGMLINESINFYYIFLAYRI